MIDWQYETDRNTLRIFKNKVDNTESITSNYDE